MPQNKDLLHEIEILIKSKYRIVFLKTAEEQRAESILRLIADYMNLPFFVWSRTKGLKRKDIETKGPVYNSTDLQVALTHISSSKFPAIYHFQGLGAYMDDKMAAGLLKDASSGFDKMNAAIVITGENVKIPDLIKNESAVVKMPDPDPNEYGKLLDRIIRDLRFKNSIVVEIDSEGKTHLLNNVRGLTLTEAEKVLTKVIVVDNKLSPADIKKVIEAKKQIIEKDGVLEYYPVEESMDSIAGLKNLKDWLSKRKNIISKPDEAKKFGLEFPRGILVLGVPGCGKSLCAKAVAMEWNLPLLKFDTANLYNKYVGETEKNLNNAIRTAERISPVILWIDEIEKAFSQAASDYDGGVSTRIFGTFLSWMQERKGDVFIFATANDVSKLPPEFLRKGRFDEIFFVDLPDTESRNKIFEIHLAKRGKDIKSFNLDILVDMTDGFSGAEIEQVIVSGLYTAFSEGMELSPEILEKEIESTVPLSVSMAERISSIRSWAKERTLNAN